MKAISEIVKIQKPNNLTTEEIEKKLNAQGIDPIRWAIVKADKTNLLLSVAHAVKYSYDKENNC